MVSSIEAVVSKEVTECLLLSVVITNALSTNQLSMFPTFCSSLGIVVRNTVTAYNFAYYCDL